MEYNVLVVEDEIEICDAIEIYLKTQGYHVYKANNGQEGLNIISNQTIHLAIVDIMMPIMDGIQMTMKVRENYDFPIIMLSAKSEDIDKITGLNIGADDYVTKPFSMKILSRKIDVILKRTVLVSQLIFEDGYLSIDMDNVKVSVKGRECSVTPTECRLLRQFLLNRGQLLTYDLLLERLWDSGSQFVDRHALAVNINRLRGKIEDETHKYISNVYGMGYQWIG